MIDLGFIGKQYTWSSKHKNNRTLNMERIDGHHRNHAWLKIFPHSSVHHLAHTHLDHCIILLNFIRSLPHSNKIFILESIWIRPPDFKNIVRRSLKNNANYIGALENFFKAIKTWKK